MPRAPTPTIELEYEVRGEGTPLVMITGIGAQMVHWPPGFLQALIDRGFQLVLFDNRDSGLSGKLESMSAPNLVPLVARWLAGLHVPSPYRLEDMARDVCGLMDHLGIETAHILGASLGGFVAQTFAIEFPSRTRSLISVMSNPGGRTNLLMDPRSLIALIGKTPKSPEDAGDNSVRLVQQCGSKGFEIDEQSIRERAALGYQRSVYPAGFLRQMAAALASGRRTQKLREMERPTLVVHGTDDTLLRPAGAREMAKEMPNAELLMVEGMGHDLPRGAWPIVVDAIESHVKSNGNGA